MSDTPRTDALLPVDDGVIWKHARELERELNGFVRELGLDDPQSPPAARVVLAMVELQQLKRELNGWRACAERLALDLRIEAPDFSAFNSLAEFERLKNKST